MVRGAKWTHTDRQNMRLDPPRKTAKKTKLKKKKKIKNCDIRSVPKRKKTTLFHLPFKFLIRQKNLFFLRYDKK